MQSKLAYKKIAIIEQEVKDLKELLHTQRKVVSLRGKLKGTTITENEIEEAKKSLFRV